jgi:hypothetical protein
MSDTDCSTPVSCDFEDLNNNLCSWMNTENTIDDFDWRVISTLDDSTFGYIPDKTTDSVYGNFAMANGLKNGHYARLFSEKLERNSDTGVCFKFYYYFEGCKYKSF